MPATRSAASYRGADEKGKAIGSRVRGKPGCADERAGRRRIEPSRKAEVVAVGLDGGIIGVADIE